MNQLVRRIIIPTLLIAGAAARTLAWWQNRSLTLDEANLARNICEKSFTEFFGRLDYDQYAPPLFCAFCKFFTQVFGNTEQSLRAFPLICGLISIWLFFYVAQKMISNDWILLITTWVFCFSETQIEYSSECKQYIVDVFVALAIIAFCLWQLKNTFRPAIAAILGVLAPWLSMPSVFILAGVGIVFMSDALKSKNRRLLIQTGAISAIWMLSFALYYFTILKKSVDTSSLNQYHQPWFFPLIPSTKSQMLQVINLLKAFPYFTSGYTVLSLFAGGLGIIIGLVSSARKKISAFLLLGVPVILCIIASGFQFYSLIPRLILWTFVLLMLIQGIGWQWIIDRVSAYVAAPIIVLLFVAVSVNKGWQVFNKPMQTEEVRSVLDTISFRFADDEELYVHQEAWPAFAFYHDCYFKQDNYQFGNRIIQGTWNSKPSKQIITIGNTQHTRVWLVYSHVISQATRESMTSDLQVIGEYAHQVDSIKAVGAFAYLYEF